MHKECAFYLNSYFYFHPDVSVPLLQELRAGLCVWVG